MMDTNNLEELKNELQKSINQQEKVVDLLKQVLSIPRDDFEVVLLENQIDTSTLHGQLKAMYNRFSLERRLPNMSFKDVEFIMEEFLIKNSLIKKSDWGYIPTEKGKKYLGIDQWASGGNGFWMNYYVFEFEELLHKVFPDILER